MPASEKTLGKLHEAVAAALTEQVEGYTETVVTEEGKEIEKVVKPSPALLTAAISFLKNNNITADPEQNEALSELRNKLRDRRAGKVPQAALDAAAEEFSRMAGGPLQ